MSQLDWLSSTTAMIVLFWSRATRDLLKSFGWGIAALHRLHAARKLPSPRRPPHRISRSPSMFLCSAIHPIERLFEHGLVPGAVPRLDIRFDLPEEIGVRPLLGVRPFAQNARTSR